MREEDEAASSLDLATNSVSTRNNLPWRSRRNGLEHREFAQWLSITPSADSSFKLDLISEAFQRGSAPKQLAYEMPDRG
jgi:hypothetical protein